MSKKETKETISTHLLTKREQKYPIWEIEFLSRKRKEVLNALKTGENLSQNGIYTDELFKLH